MKIKDLKIMIKEKMDEDSVLLATPELLTEASYWRVKNKIENKKIPFAMISAFRGGLSRSKNLQRQKELESIVADAKFPWTKMPGSGYVEEPEDNGESQEVRENSILIWAETRPDAGPKEEEDLSLFELAQFLANKYNQDTFIYGEPVNIERTGDRQMFIKLYDKDGNPINQFWAGPWSTLTQIGDDDLFWSTIGSKKAKLTELQDKYHKMPVKNKLDAMEKQHYLDAIKEALKYVQMRK